MAAPESSTSSGGTSSWWVLEAQDLWLSGALDRCVDILEKNYTPNVTFSEAATSSADKGGSKPAIQSKPIAEGAALLHNLLMAKYLLKGTVIPVKIPPPPEMPAQTNKQSQKKPNTTPTETQSLLDPSRYKQDSLKRALASLGYHTSTAWYNLAVLFFVKGQFRQSARIAEECLEKGLNATSVVFDTRIASQLHFLLIFSHIKLLNYSHPKIALSLNWLEKTLTVQLEDLRRKAASQDRISGLQERIAWIHVLRTHISLVGGKVKATKREMSSLNSSLYQLAQSQRPTGSAAGAVSGSQGGGSTSSNSNGAEDDEDRPADAAAGSPGVASRAVAQILRARLHDVRHNPSKAADELDFSPAIATGADVIQQLPQLFPDAYWNNLAILSHHKGKTHRSVLTQFFQAATASDGQSARAHSEWHQTALASAAQDSSPEIMYNTGVILMQLEKYADALTCFQLAAKRAQSTLGSPAFPLLGLRLAECHVQVYNQQRAQKSEANAQPVYFKPGSIVRIEKTSMDAGDVSEHISAAKSNLFEYSRAADSPSAAPTPSPNPYKEYLLKLYSKVLLAYVELESGNPVSARDVASQAIDLPRVAFPSSAPTVGEAATQAVSYENQISNYLLCAHLYLAEAMLRTGSPAEAEKLIQQASSHASGISNDMRIAAKCALAAAFLVRGKLDNATKILDSLESEAPTNPSTDILRVWLHLKQKQVDHAIRILKHRKLPSGFHVRTKAVPVATAQ